MPKIIDHASYRIELATKAIDVFKKHGYHGLGMRGISDAIGISKSALYHYYPSKKELFAAATELITQPHNLHGKSTDELLSETRDINDLITTFDSIFQGEIILLTDYLRGKSSGEIATDPLMNLANTRYLKEIEESTDCNDKNIKQAYALLLGGLLLRWFDGNQTKINDISSWIGSLPKTTD